MADCLNNTVKKNVIKFELVPFDHLLRVDLVLVLTHHKVPDEWMLTAQWAVDTDVAAAL